MIKDLTAKTFDDYRKNIQLQFNDDTQFVQLVKIIADTANSYEETLIDLSKALYLSDDLAVVSDRNEFILNSIGSLLNLPNITYFTDYLDKDSDGNISSYANYLLIVRGQILKNSYDGTNASLVSLLNEVFDNKFYFILTDTGTMEITISVFPSTPISDNEKAIIQNGYLTPKVAGVKINYEFLSSENAIFSWGTKYKKVDGKVYSGWTSGHWTDEE